MATGTGRNALALGEPIAVAAAFGGLLGLVLAPVAAWTLMRHVPLWRAIAETALGTVVGFVLGWLLGPMLGLLGPGGPPWLLLFPLGGFTAAAVRLRLTHRGARGALATPEAPPD